MSVVIDCTGSILSRARTALEAGLNQIPADAVLPEVHPFIKAIDDEIHVLEHEDGVARAGAALLWAVGALVVNILDGLQIKNAKYNLSNKTSGNSQRGDLNVQLIPPSSHSAIASTTSLEHKTPTALAKHLSNPRHSFQIDTTKHLTNEKAIAAKVGDVAESTQFVIYYLFILAPVVHSHVDS